MNNQNSMSVLVESEFTAIGSEAWDALVASSSPGSAAQSWRWCTAWWQAYRETARASRELFLAVVTENGVVRAIAPLMVDIVAGRRVLKFVGDGHLHRADFLCADHELHARQLLLDALALHADCWDELAFNHLPAQSPTVALLTAWAQRLRLSAACRTVAPYAAVCRTDPASSASSVYPAEPGLTVVHCTSPGEILTNLNAYFVQHIHRWSSPEVPSVFVERPARDFKRRLVEALGGDGQLLFTSVRSQDAALAHHLGIASGRSLLWSEPSFDVLGSRPELERVLLRGVIAAAFDRGFVDVVFPRNHPSLARHVPELRARVSVRVTRNSVPSFPTRARDRVARTGMVRRVRALTAEARQVAQVARNAAQIIEGRKKLMEAASSHRDFYDTGSITRQYVRETTLQKPEQEILRELRAELAHMRVLDIGVGAGRTVPFFGALAHAYTGLDISPNMVSACRQRVGDLVNPSAISCGDARDLGQSDASFDLVLISYNGIDDVSEAERFKILAEVRRVLAPGGYFCFSSHNMKSLTPSGGRGLVEQMRRWRRYKLISTATPGLSELRSAPHAMIYDVGLNYALPHYYISPSAQQRQLAEVGFTDVRVFSVNTGREVREPGVWDTLTDSWVYYLCRG